MTWWPWLILVTAYGACVGSFLNVVIYRLPADKSLVSPPSSCPHCGNRLAWHDNVPVLAWLLWLRGRCRQCKAPISVQYPLIEATCAGLFALMFVGYYVTGWRPDWMTAGLADTWPVLVVHLFLVAALLASTMIDAKLFIIPLQIPWAATLAALLLLPAGAWLWPPVIAVSPVAAGAWAGAGAGAAAGLGLSVLLLRLEWLPMSFAEEVEDWTQYPHARREVLKECLFLALPVAGAVGGWYGLDGWVHADSPEVVRVLAGVVVGYLVGGAVVWATRIFGTLAFGREAMGLGDVHLMAAVGAAAGAIDSTLAFFVAPFFGLAAYVVMLVLAKVTHTGPRIIPYGPYLAGASVVVMLFREPILAFVGIL